MADARGARRRRGSRTHTHARAARHRRRRRSKRTGRRKNEDWLSLFDVVVVGCGKPGFFNERRPLFAVNTRDGSLMNTDNGAPRSGGGAAIWQRAARR